MSNRTKEEIVKDIKFVLEDKVAPSVAQHNGFINFLDFDMELGVAKLELAGACSGCAMSKQTLHQGVEDMLKHYVPEVQAIICLLYTSPSPRDLSTSRMPSSA